MDIKQQDDHAKIKTFSHRIVLNRDINFGF